MATYDGDITLSAGLDASDAIATANKVNKEIETILSKSSGVDVSAKFKSLLATFENLKSKSVELSDKLRDLETIKTPTEKYTELENKIAEINAEMQKITTDENYYASLGFSDSEPSVSIYREMTADVQQLEAELQTVKSDMQDLVNSGQAFQINTGEYNQVVNALNSVTNEATIVKQQLLGLNEIDLHPIRDTFTQTVASLGRGTAAIIKFGASLPIKGAQKLANALGNAVSRAVQLAKSTITSGIKKLGKAISGIGKSSNGTNDALKKGIKMFLRYGLGVRSLFALINKIRRAVVEGFEILAQAHEPFNVAISNLTTAFNTLKGSLSAAFAPLIEFIEPALTRFIYLVSDAISKVGMLIAALTGKEFVRAIPVQQNYAESVGDTSKKTDAASKAMKKQNKQAKELQKTLASFDDVNILKDNRDKDDEEEEEETKTPSVAFATQPIDGAFRNFADKLKSMWANADFSELGSILGRKLLDALNRIPWDKIKETLRRVAHSIATFLNGFLETPGLFTKIGETLAQALNSAFEFLNEFVHTFHWDSLGAAIRDLILGLVNNIDWPLIYDTMATAGAGIATALDTALNNPEVWSGIFTTISMGLNSILLLLDSFLKGIDWATLGANIGNGLNDGVNAFDWNLLGQTLIDLVNGAFDLWYNFVTTFDFYKFGEHIGTTFSQAVNGINWTEGGASVAQTINGLFEAIHGFIVGTDWKSLGSSIIDAIVGFFSELDWGEQAATFSAAIKALLDTLTGAFQEVEWDKLPGQIVSAITDFLTNFDWEGTATAAGELIGAAFTALVALGGELWNTMKEVGNNIMAGGLQGIIDALTGIGDWIKLHILDPFVTGFKSVFGIASPSTEMEPLGGYIIAGMLEGIKNGLINIVEWLKENVANKVIDGFKSVFGIDGEEPLLLSIGKNLISGLKDGLTSAMDGMKGWVESNVTGPICNFFKDLFDMHSPSKVFKGYGKNLMEGLEEGVEENVGIVTDDLETANSDMLSAFDDTEDWSTSGGNLMTEGLKKGLDKDKSTVERLVINLEKAMRDAFKDHLEDWIQNGQSLIRHLVIGLKNIEGDAKTKVSNIGKDMIQIMRDLEDEYSDTGSSYMRNLMLALESGGSYAVATAQNIARDMHYQFYSADWSQIGRDITVGIYNGIVANWQWLNDTAWNLAQSVYNSARNSLGIASPSKVFRDGIGKMIPAGMAVGIMDNEDSAVKATDDLIHNILTKAENVDPTITLDTQLSDTTNVLSDMLNNYSTIIVDNFTALIGTLQKIANMPNALAIAQGRILPYSAIGQQSSQTDSVLPEIISKLDDIMDSINSRITYDDVVEIVKRHLSWKIGDEDLARHANAGNVKLDRRFNTVRMG